MQALIKTTSYIITWTFIAQIILNQQNKNNIALNRFFKLSEFFNVCLFSILQVDDSLLELKKTEKYSASPSEFLKKKFKICFKQIISKQKEI